MDYLLIQKIFFIFLYALYLILLTIEQTFSNLFSLISLIFVKEYVLIKLLIIYFLLFFT